MNKRILLAGTLILSVLLVLAPQGTAAPGPRFDNMQFTLFRDATAWLAAFKAGALESSVITTEADLTELTGLGYKITSVSPFTVSFHFLNMRRAPMSDLKFRQAVAHLIPKESIRDSLMAGGAFGVLRHTFMPYGFWAVDETTVPDVTEFNPALAASMLDAAGYTKNANGIRTYPNGTEMRQLDIEFPDPVAGIAYIFAFGDRWVVEMNKIGIPAKLNLLSMAGSGWIVKLLVQHDFDAFFINYMYAPGEPTVLNALWGKTATIPISGYNNPNFDGNYSIFANTLNLTEAQQAGFNMQACLQADLPAIPIYSGTTVAAYSPSLAGIMGAPYTSQNAQMRMRFKSSAGGTYRTGTVVEPASMILGWDALDQAAQYFGYVCGTLADQNPFTGVLAPWVATKWSTEPWSDSALNVTKGTRLTVSVRDDIYWHDGVKFTANDVVFAANYGFQYKPTVMAPFMDRFVKALAVNDTTFDFYFNKTSILILDQNLRTPYLLGFPKHIFNPNATIYGEPEGPMGLQTPGVPGVPDPSKFAGAYVKHPNPPADKPWLTCLIGVGLYMLQKNEVGVGAVFVANHNFWTTVLFGDTNYDRKVNILDMSAAAVAFGTKPGDAKWAISSDINGDNVVNILDLATIALDWGKSY